MKTMSIAHRSVVVLCVVGLLDSAFGAGPSLSGARATASAPERILYWGMKPHPSLWMIAPSGRGRAPLFRTPQNAKRPQLSPNGQQLVFDGAPTGQRAMSVFRVQIVGSKGGVPRTLTAGTRWQLDARWRPDGRVLSYSEMPAGPDWQKSWIWTMTPDGGHKHRVARGQNARWSPDGSRLVVDAPTPSSAGDLFTLRADGSGVHRLTHTRALEQPTDWSPDGKHILYTRYSADMSRSDVFQLDLDNLSVLQLTRGGSASEASYSPRGSEVAFIRDNGTDACLYLIRLGQNGPTGEPRRLTCDANDPVWQR